MLLKYSNKSILLFLILFLLSCSNNHFIIYTMNGKIEQERSSAWSSNSGVMVYFSKEDIKHDYEEINIIATNNFYYGQFFFDDIFMNILKDKAASINADAIVFEKNRIDYPNYNKDYLFFTAIRYKNKNGHSVIIH